MQLTYSTDSGIKIIHVAGRIDTITAGDFESEVMTNAQDDNAVLVLDCSNLDYISSSGLRVFLILQKKLLSNSGKLLLSSMQPSIKEVFDISGFSTIFSIFPDLDSAIQSK